MSQQPSENPANAARSVKWTDAELDVFVQYLHQYQKEHFEAGFKDSTFSGALEHIKQFYSSGKSKDIKSLHNKWNSVHYNCPLIFVYADVLHSLNQSMSLSVPINLSPASIGTMNVARIFKALLSPLSLILTWLVVNG